MPITLRIEYAEGLAEAGIMQDDLPLLPKGAAVKIELARRLRGSTTLTLKEIALLLYAGNWRSLANSLSKAKICQYE